MAAAHAKTLTIGWAKSQATRIAREPKRRGFTPERYVKQLIESDLEIARIARTRTFAQIMGPDQPLDEAELDRLVDEARTDHDKQKSRRK